MIPIHTKIQNNFEEFFRLTAQESFHTNYSTGILSELEDPYFNSILRTAPILDPNHFDIEINQVLSKYHNKKSSLCWFINDTSTQQQLDPHLTNIGFKEHGSYNGMALELSEYNASKIILPNNVEIIEVTKSEQLDDWVKPFSISFGFTEHDSNIYSKLFKQLVITNPNIKYHIAYCDEKAVGSSTILFTENTAGLYNLGVIPKYRNRGIGLALQQTRLNLAQARQCETVVIQAAETSGKLAQKLGFVKYNTYHTYLYSFEG